VNYGGEKFEKNLEEVIILELLKEK